MAPPEGGLFCISVASVVEDVLQQHGARLSDIDLASRKAEEAAARRYEAAGWLRKTVGVVGAKDLPEQPSEEEFRLGLRNGLILCNVLNKVQPGAIPKVVENPGDSVLLPDGAALSAYQYFENVRNFLDAIQEMGLPAFEASDLEQGGKGARVVNSVLALKSYSDGKQMGGSRRFGGNSKTVTSGKYFTRKNAEPFMNSLSRSLSVNEKSTDQNLSDDFPHESSEMVKSRSLDQLVRAVLSDKQPEEIPVLVESMLNKVMEEFQRRLASQNELVRTTLKDVDNRDKSSSEWKVSAKPTTASVERKLALEDEKSAQSIRAHNLFNANANGEEDHRLVKQRLIFDKQQRDIQDLKQILRSTRAGFQFMQMKYSEEFCYLGKHLHSMAHAASGYNRVLEENRKLYNQVQDLKGSIRVYCRIRPFLPGKPTSISTVGQIDDGRIMIITPSKYGKEGHRSFNFNKVFGPSATQDEVFSDTQPLIRSVLDGYNVCIFAYGQTGSGKTYTMTGPKDITRESQGVNYRALSDLFLLSEQRKEAFSYDIAVQMIEIYNEQVRDLLVNDGLNRRLEIRNSSQKGLNVPDANLVPVASTSEVIELMNIGQRNRAVGATALNERSSRSHSCLTIHVQGREMTSGITVHGCMHLVDLAGSERVNKSEAMGDRLKEAQHINKSLSALGDVIAALAQKNSHVPYRNSKLTQLLQDSLGGQAKTLMFVHVSPEVDAVAETISTLKFAERVSTVELGAARLNKESGEVKELKEQIACLKAALARKGGEHEHLQSLAPSPEIHRMKSSAPSPMQPNRQRGGKVLVGHSNHRQPMEEVGNIEVRNSAIRKKKPSFDLQEVLTETDSPPWSDSSFSVCFQKHGDKETASGDWSNQVIVNKQEELVGEGDSWEQETAPLPEFFYQRYLHDTRTHPDGPYQQYNTAISRKGSHEFEFQRSRSECATTDDSDDLEIVTSDSSEADMLWHFNLPKATSAVSSSGSTVKKPQPKQDSSPDMRTPIQTHGPLQRKLSNGSDRSLKPGRQLVSVVDGKRHTPNGKIGGSVK